MSNVDETEYEEAIVRLMVAGRTDKLTGLGNYSAFMEYCGALCLLGVPFSIVMLDLTNLKRANEMLGHFGADVLLHKVGQSIRAGGWDAVFRYGGDEFAVVLPACSAGGAVGVRDRIEEMVGTQTLPDHTPVRAIGSVAHLPPGGDLHSELNRADKALESRKAQWKTKYVQ